MLKAIEMKDARQAKKANLGGRPRKFTEASRPITITLPEKTLRGLERIDPDRGRAIVKVTERALNEDGQPRPMVEVVEVDKKVGLVIVGPSQALRRIPFLRLVEVAPSRFVLALEAGKGFNALELSINDLLEDLPADHSQERQLITELQAHIRNLRRADRVSLANILLVRMDTV